jgi:hypothetical protein
VGLLSWHSFYSVFRTPSQVLLGGGLYEHCCPDIAAGRDSAAVVVMVIEKPGPRKDRSYHGCYSLEDAIKTQDPIKARAESLYTNNKSAVSGQRIKAGEGDEAQRAEEEGERE